MARRTGSRDFNHGLPGGVLLFRVTTMARPWATSIQMNKLTFAVLALLCFSSCAFAATTDFDADLQAAAAKLEALLSASGELLTAGDVAGANARLLAAFPEATRTPTESFVLGNMFFELDRKLSYALHKSAAAGDPGNSQIAWEWGVEQHRAGEYAAALESYKKYSADHPQLALPYALEADCYLRLNRVDDAVAAWRKSEDAPQGTVEAMEDMVCAVHREPAPHKIRADLLAKVVKQKDIAAAQDLIALDCQFPIDWWNVGPQSQYLAHDAPIVKDAIKSVGPDDVRVRAIACAIDCMTGDNDADAIRKIFDKYHLLTDADHTVVAHGGLLYVLVSAAMNAKLMDESAMRQQIAPKALDLARKGHDAELWDIAVYAAPLDQHDRFLALQREAWKATGDQRFAGQLLYIKLDSGKLEPDDA